MEQNVLKPIYILLVDISGYTRFISAHSISLLHAEKIVAELMESILREVEFPVTAHEILGDAISLYALDENVSGQADLIYTQLEKYFRAFREREASLISECSICKCDACKQVGKLRLKAILHHGIAAFTQIQGIQKISGQPVILSHRLLKNSLTSKEYILLTRDFADRCNSLNKSDFRQHQEEYEDIGHVMLLARLLDSPDVIPVRMSLWQRIRYLLSYEGYLLARLLYRKNDQTYRNFPSKSRGNILN